MKRLRYISWGIFCVLAIAAPSADPQVKFVDVSSQAGIHFTHYNGAAGNKWLPETMGSGCAFIDLDGDGWADILLLNNKSWTPARLSISPRSIATTGTEHSRKSRKAAAWT